MGGWGFKCGHSGYMTPCRLGGAGCGRSGDKTPSLARGAATKGEGRAPKSRHKWLHRRLKIEKGWSLSCLSFAARRLHLFLTWRTGCSLCSSLRTGPEAPPPSRPAVNPLPPAVDHRPPAVSRPHGSSTVLWSVWVLSEGHPPCARHRAWHRRCPPPLCIPQRGLAQRTAQLCVCDARLGPEGGCCARPMGRGAMHTCDRPVQWHTAALHVPACQSWGCDGVGVDRLQTKEREKRLRRRRPGGS